MRPCVDLPQVVEGIPLEIPHDFRRDLTQIVGSHHEMDTTRTTKLRDCVDRTGVVGSYYSHHHVMKHEIYNRPGEI